MRSLLIFSITVIFLSSFIVLESLQPENEIKKYIGNSVPYIGSEIPRMDGIDGTGIKIAVIDTAAKKQDASNRLEQGKAQINQLMQSQQPPNLG